MIKKAINKETNQEHAVLINTRTLNAKQMSFVNDMIAYYDAKAEELKARADAANFTEDIARYAARMYQRNEIKSAHFALRQKLASAYYIAKNVACKRANHLYDLKVFKLDAKIAKEQSKTDETRDAEKIEKQTKRAHAKARETKKTKKSKQVAVQTLDTTNDESVANVSDVL